MRKSFFLILLLFVVILNVSSDESLEIGLDLDNHFTDEITYYNEINPYFIFRMPFLTAVADLSLINDQKYKPDGANLPDGTLLGYYTIMNNGYLKLDYDDFNITIGQIEQTDVIDSDYSLFISSNQNPAFIAEFNYDGEFIFYETRWIRLNERSAQGYVDRGANFKTYALKLGDFRLGFQDAAVYLDRSFDLEYFVNPIPQYFIQYNKIYPGRPWQTESNENNLIGAFLEYTDSDMYLYAQYLMDDFNLYWLLPDTPHNPNKMAYALGGRLDTEWGRFSFDTALAFKYTYEATYARESYSDYPYEYTYYPASLFTNDGEDIVIGYEDNYLGYKYGENNLAVQVGYKNSFEVIGQIPLNINAGLEYVISGSKSPSNPWHELDWHTNEGTKFLDDDVLEHTIRSKFGTSAEYKGFKFSAGMVFGYVFNELELTEVVSGEAPIFVPIEGNDRFIVDFSFSLGYSIKF